MDGSLVTKTNVAGRFGHDLSDVRGYHRLSHDDIFTARLGRHVAEGVVAAVVVVGVVVVGGVVAAKPC